MHSAGRGKAAATPGMSPGFMAINRGKQSVALDLKAPDDLACMKALLEEADVFVLNVRGKAVERLGLDYDAVRGINPNIIYAHCVGFGQDGPYADLQAYDDVIQAATGTATLLPRVDGDPRARYLPSLIADKVAASMPPMRCSRLWSTNSGRVRGRRWRSRCSKRSAISCCSNIWPG
nr:CoA transferase [Novosphingobium sp. NBM11]